MQTYFVGDLIRKRRKELNLTQEQLGEGLCEPVTISRLENGRQTPPFHTLRALLQRLGLPEHKYIAFLNANEQEISLLMEEIVSCNTLKDSPRGLAAIEQLEKIAPPNDPLIQQLVLRSKAGLGKRENRQIVPYTLEEELDMLFRAIRLTAPRFDLDTIHQGLYCLDEVKVINQIATAYSDLGEQKKAVDIYYQLLKYIKSHFKNILQSGGLLPLVSFNYARELDLAGRYAEAVEIAQTGWDACKQYGQYYTLPSAIALIAECYHFLGKDDQSKDLYRQAYYVYKAIGNARGVSVVEKETKKYFGEEFTL